MAELATPGVLGFHRVRIKTILEVRKNVKRVTSAWVEHTNVSHAHLGPMPPLSSQLVVLSVHQVGPQTIGQQASALSVCLTFMQRIPVNWNATHAGMVVRPSKEVPLSAHSAMLDFSWTSPRHQSHAALAALEKSAVLAKLRARRVNQVFTPSCQEIRRVTHAPRERTVT